MKRRTHNKPGLLRDLEESESTVFEDPKPQFLENQIRFSFRYCSVGRNYCVTSLSNEQVQRFYNIMKKFEDMTWGQVKRLPREKGFSFEPKKSATHRQLDGQHGSKGLSTFFHFRVGDKFRIFAGQQREMCCVLLIDPEGRVQGH